MAHSGDPYRTLGIEAAASLNEIRSAYRRLVKQWHPDAAGERALPRFLAIQAAYEALVDADGRLRTSTGRGGQSGPSWRADAARARATREAYRTRRSGTPSGARSTDASSASGAASAGGAAGSGRPAGSGRGAGSSRSTTGSGTAESGTAGSGTAGSRERRRRPTRKATPGSTSYDEALEQRDPAWAGADWYGPSLGTYWTINPREYADPRKHGPDYAARARRAAAERAAATGEPPGPSAPAEAATATDSSEPADLHGWRWSSDPRSATDAGEADWSARSWTYATPGETSRPRPTGAGKRAFADAQPAGTRLSDAGFGVDLEALVRRASPSRLRRIAARATLRDRLVLALVAWPPIGLLAATAIEALTGCGGFAAGCSRPETLAPLVVQPLIVAILVLLPTVAAVAAFAALVGLGAAVPLAIVLSAAGGASDPVAARAILAVVVPAVYLVALGAALARTRTGRGEPPAANDVP